MIAKIRRLFVQFLVNTKDEEQGFLKLFIAKRLIHGAATALLGVFVPIYIYTITGESFYIVGGYYAVVSLAYVLMLVPGMQIMNGIGFRKALVIGGVASVATYSLLYWMDSAEDVWLLLGLLAGLTVIFRVFHWVPYHVDFTLFTSDGQRGRSVGITYATIAFMGVVGPILAGYIIQNSGYNALFAVAIVLLVLATISYAFVPDTDEKFTWTFKRTVQNLFAKKYRPMTSSMFASGLENTFNLIVWPIFLYEIFDGNVFDIGVVSTLVVGLTIIIQLGLGSYIDKKKNSGAKTLRIGSTLYAVGWVFKIFVLSIAQVFFVGLYHSITRIFVRTPIDTTLYDMSADQGHYVDEFSLLREMSVHIGRVLGLVIVVSLSLFVSIEWTFILAALASVALNMVYATRAVRKK
ncbi:MFS transporter [Candidatus Kaiserbacteria bacterium]|nr:MFS transporter [Candidatus Kaiserbacteria bacterium]